jgi:hypothetical protein
MAVTTILSMIVISQIGPYRYQVQAHTGRLGVAKA